MEAGLAGQSRHLYPATFSTSSRGIPRSDEIPPASSGSLSSQLDVPGKPPKEGILSRCPKTVHEVMIYCRTVCISFSQLYVNLQQVPRCTCWQLRVYELQVNPLPSQAQGSLSSDELRVHLSVPSDNVVINNTHSYSSRYQRIHTFPDDRDHDREGEGEYQEPSALLRPRDHRDSTGRL